MGRRRLDAGVRSDASTRSARRSSRRDATASIAEDALVLGIETSCDETAVAVVRGGREILSNVIASQAELHAPFGGVVPEIASRAHVEQMPLVVDKALRDAGIGVRDLHAVAATRGPGLIGALLVGWATGKAMAGALGVPFSGVHHIEGHIFASVLGDDPFDPPFIALVVSGGHTSLFAVRELGALRGPRPDPGRCRRRSLRQDRALPRSRLPGRPGDRQALEARQRGGRRVPAGAAAGRPRLQLLGPEDGRCPPRPSRRGGGGEDHALGRRRLVPGGDRGRPGQQDPAGVPRPRDRPGRDRRGRGRELAPAGPSGGRGGGRGTRALRPRHGASASTTAP